MASRELKIFTRDEVAKVSALIFPPSTPLSTDLNTDDAIYLSTMLTTMLYVYSHATLRAFIKNWHSG